MKKILEYRVFDVLKNKENEEFLDKVKKENPDLYVRFLNLVKNKGLDIAKDKYQEHDPEYIKSEKQRIKREKTKEFKEKKQQQLLRVYSNEINSFKITIDNTLLKRIQKIINADKNILEYLNNFRIRKRYKSFLNDILKNLKYLRSRSTVKLDALSYYKLEYSEYEFEKYEATVILIRQNYLLTEDLSYFKLDFNPVVAKFGSVKEVIKGEEYIKYRNKEISNLSEGNLNEEQLIKKIKKFSYYLSEDFYEEWKLKNDAQKYNL